jgi:hypothetical protein
LDDFSKSRFITKGGELKEGIKIKLNLMQNTIHYLDSAGNEIVLETPVNGFAIEQNGTGKLFYFVDGSTLPIKQTGWFQMLVKDTVSVVKQITKRLTYRNSYGSPIEYNIQTEDNYIAFYKDREYIINKPSDLLQIIPERKIEIESYIKKLKKLSKENQIVSIIELCNKLVKLDNG